MSRTPSATHRRDFYRVLHLQSSVAKHTTLEFFSKTPLAILLVIHFFLTKIVSTLEYFI